MVRKERDREKTRLGDVTLVDVAPGAVLPLHALGQVLPGPRLGGLPLTVPTGLPSVSEIH